MTFKNSTDKFTKFLKKNKWIIIASIIFIIWKFFLIGILWQDRVSPPEPDDSFIYIANIESVRNCSTFIFCQDSVYNLNTTSGYEHLSYRLIFGTLGKILNINSFQVFHLSFYIGIILLIPTLVYFLKSLNQDKKIIAFSLLFLALYNGNGSYHGFYWVVPSFFSLMLFFLIFSIIDLGNKHYKLLLFLTVPIFAYMHSISIYLMMLIPIHYAIYSISLKKINLTKLKRIVFSILIFAIFYIPSTIHLSNFSKNNPYGASSLLKKSYEDMSMQLSQAKDIKTANISKEKHIKSDPIYNNKSINIYLPGLKNITNNYLNWVFFNWLGASVSILMLTILFLNKAYKLLSIYATAIFFMLASSIIEYGERSLIFVWPITFILFAQGTWLSLKFLKNNVHLNKFAFKILASIAIGLFLYININYSFFLNFNQNKNANFNIPSSFINYIPYSADKSDTIFMDPKLVKIYESLAVMEKRSLPYKRVSTMEDANFYYYLNYNEASSEYVEKNNFMHNFIRITGFKESVPLQRTLEVPINFVLCKEFGSVQIYKNIEI